MISVREYDPDGRRFIRCRQPRTKYLRKHAAVTGNRNVLQLVVSGSETGQKYNLRSRLQFR